MIRCFGLPKYPQIHSPVLAKRKMAAKPAIANRRWTHFRSILVSCAPPGQGTYCQDDSGQEGFEPPTRGFGIRRSTNSSYWPSIEEGTGYLLVDDLTQRKCQAGLIAAATPSSNLHKWLLLGFFVRCGLAAPLAILVKLQLIWSRSLIFVRVIVPALAFFAFKRNQNTISASHRKPLRKTN